MKRLLAMTCVLGVVGMGCRDLCAVAEDCAKKSGDAFSITQCRNEYQTGREQANTKGCAPQFDEYFNCISNLQCGSTDEQISANCGAKGNAFSKCLE
jgi:hypothetical protein